ncbi:MAG: manganese efflux pump MntP [Planctomycetota bacterium]|jgi:putative Mn2+ efflux pump MntP
MDYITIVVIAVGLAMDAFVVSIVSGSVYKQLRIRHALRIALFFGGFQAVMPLIGALAGLTLREYIESCHCWIAFGLLAAVGLKMIYESFKIKSVEENFDPSNIFVLLVLSVATSIDALAVGITLSLIAGSIITAAVIIGLITFVLSYLGVFIGKKFGHFFETKLEAVGGLILIGIGVKILLEHVL